jgi:hypothetical protein
MNHCDSHHRRVVADSLAKVGSPHGYHVVVAIIALIVETRPPGKSAVEHANCCLANTMATQLRQSVVMPGRPRSSCELRLGTYTIVPGGPAVEMDYPSAVCPGKLRQHATGRAVYAPQSTRGMTRGTLSRLTGTDATPRTWFTARHYRIAIAPDVRRCGKGLMEISAGNSQNAQQPPVQAIPLILHQIWYQGESQLPDKYRRYRASWQRHHPAWRCILWDAASLRAHVATYCPDFLPIYDGFGRDIQRMDSARYCLLDTVGGLYADMDIECLRPVDELLSGRELILSETDGYNNALMGSTPGHALWKTVFNNFHDGMTASLQDVPARMRMSDAMQIAITAGPRFFTMCVKDSDVLTKPTTLSCPSNYFEAIPMPAGDSRTPGVAPYGRHDMDMNWLSPMNRRVSKLTRIAFSVTQSMKRLWAG